MLTANFERRAEDDEVDDGQTSFFALASRLLGMVQTDAPPAPLRAAVETFRTRLALHAAGEEEAAARLDAGATRILQEDHREILSALTTLANGIGRLGKAQVRTEVEHIMAMIAKHEREVDGPLFRMISRRR